MIALLCALLSGAGFYLSIGLGDQWAIAWIAPIPILWLAFGDGASWRVWLASVAAYAIGGANVLPAYGGVMPFAVLALSIVGPALILALAVAGARLAYRKLGAIPGVLVFGALWAGLDFLSSFNLAGGSVSTPAAAEIGAPLLVQAASLFGFPAVTFLLGAVSAGLAIAARTRRWAPGLMAIALFSANAGFGYWRLSAPATGAVRVGLIASNEAVGRVKGDDRNAASRAIDAYANAISRFDHMDLNLIVLPENMARLSPDWRDSARTPLDDTATRMNATIVAGFNTRIDGAQRNFAWMLTPGHHALTYAKRRLVLGVETPAYTPGTTGFSPINGIGLEICKDMDFAGLIRTDVARLHPQVLAVPAWDFGADGWSHARIAILRSIENGVPMARSARAGLLTLNDSYGRLIGAKPVGDGFAAVVGAIPIFGPSGQTLYARIGDLFGWLSLALGAGATIYAGLKREHLASRLKRVGVGSE